MKFLLLLILLFFACGICMTLMVRLQKVTEQIAELNQQLKRNDGRLAGHKKNLDEMSAERDKGQGTDGV